MELLGLVGGGGLFILPLHPLLCLNLLGQDLLPDELLADILGEGPEDPAVEGEETLEGEEVLLFLGELLGLGGLVLDLDPLLPFPLLLLLLCLKFLLSRLPLPLSPVQLLPELLEEPSDLTHQELPRD